jgi:gluconolactonase
MKPLVLFALLAAAALPAQDFSRVEIERVATGYQFTEGPLWSRDGYLLFTDIPANKILKYTPGQGVAVYREPSGNTNGLAFDAQGRLYLCEGAGRRLVRLDRKGALEVLADKWEGKRLNRTNDVVVRKDGHIYFTDPAFGPAGEARDLDFYGVFHVAPKGRVESIAQYKTRPNGLALSPDGKTLFVDNTDDHNVRAWDLDRNGAASRERVVISNIEGGPDGMKLDEKGNFYITGKYVSIFSPEGKLLHNIEVPEIPANCAFGDDDLRTLYITARTSLYRVRLPVKGSLPY